VTPRHPRPSVIVSGRIALVAFGALLAGTGCARTIAREAPFRARPDSTERGDLRGPFTGRVVDADTRRPIAGAMVYASWRFVDGFGFQEPAGWREHIGSTDATGAYVIPRLESGPKAPARLSDFHVVVYKRGYVAFRSDRRFDDFGPRFDFTQAGEVVALERWKPEHSHARHLRYIGGGSTLAELTAWEVADAVAELSGRRRPEAPSAPAGGQASPGLAPPAAPADELDATRLLRPADVVAQTGFEGGFDVGKLDDDPTGPTYDNVHLKARGRSESFDVAMRMWRLPPDEATQRFTRLVEELPGAQAKNEIGDRSVRAATPGGDILGLAFLDEKRGFVVLIQCGASQCRSHENVLALARLVRGRLEDLQ
jgi:hypothetical protein